MKILLVNKYLYIKGGAERYVFDLKNILERNGHQVACFGMKDRKNFDNKFEKYYLENVELNKEGLIKDFKKVGRVLYSLQAKRNLEKLVKEFKPDIAHLNNIYHHLSPSIFSVFKKYKISVVMTLHDYKLICPNYKLMTKGKVCERCKVHKYYNGTIYKCIHNSFPQSLLASIEMYFHKLFRFYEKGVAVFISPSKFLKGKCIQWKQDGNKIKHIYNSLEVKNFQPSYENQGYILFFGRLTYEKGADILIKSLKNIKQKITLKIAGEGPEMEKLKKLAQDLGVAGKVEFLGYKKQNELKELIQNAICIIAPSRWYENCPYSVLESFAYGKPVIGSNLGGLPELIGKDRGLIFKNSDPKDLAQKISIYLKDNNLAIEHGKKARALAEKLDLDKYYKQLILLYKSCIEKK